MADNTVVNPGAGGDTLATDDIGGVYKVPRCKLTIGADGVDDGDVSATNPMPTAAQGDTAHDAVDAGKPVKIGGYAKSTAPTAVAEGDRVNAWFSLNGALHVIIEAGSASIGTVASAGDIAHDAADSGNPVKIGGVANAAAPTNVADGDRVEAWFDQNGRQRMIGDIGGDIAHDSPDSATSNPIKFGGLASSAPPAAVANGDRTNAYFDTTGHQHVKVDNNITVLASTGQIYNVAGGVAVTVKFASISNVTTGTLIALVAGKKLRVLGMFFSLDAAGGVQFESSGVPTLLSGSIELLADTPVVLPVNELGYFETLVGESLERSATDTGAMNGTIVYCEI